MQVEGGAEGVGKATTKSVVTSLTSMLAMDALLTAINLFHLMSETTKSPYALEVRNLTRSFGPRKILSWTSFPSS